MTQAGLICGASWGGRPVARRIVDARGRMRLVAKGTITATGVVRVALSYACRCELDDGTGQVALIFLGRSEIPGMVKGAPCTVEGTTRDEGAELVLLNPLYTLEP